MLTFTFAMNQNVIEIYHDKVANKGLNTWFINLMKVPREFETPKGITNHSYKLPLVSNAVFRLSPSLIPI